MPIKECLYCGRQIFGRPGWVCKECERQDWFEPMLDEEDDKDGNEGDLDREEN